MSHQNELRERERERERDRKRERYIMFLANFFVLILMMANVWMANVSIANVPLSGYEADYVINSLKVDKDPRPAESQIIWKKTAEGNLSIEVYAVDPRVLRRTTTSVFEMLILALRTLNAFHHTLAV